MWSRIWLWVYVFFSLFNASQFRVRNQQALMDRQNNTGGLGYLKFLAPPERILRWIEGKMNLLGRLPHYVSVDQKTYGRFGVLPTTTSTTTLAAADNGIAMGGYVGSTQRLGP